MCAPPASLDGEDESADGSGSVAVVPSALMSCDFAPLSPALPPGPLNGGFRACPVVSGCISSSVVTYRNVDCYHHGQRVSAAACLEMAPRPVSSTQCAPAVDRCVITYPANAPCYTATGGTATCQFISGTTSTFLYRYASCADPNTTLTRPGSWCWGDGPTPFVYCNDLPVCGAYDPATGERAPDRYKSRWSTSLEPGDGVLSTFSGIPLVSTNISVTYGQCVFSMTTTCRSHMFSPAFCEVAFDPTEVSTYPPGVWARAPLSMCDFDTAPPTVVACESGVGPDPATACGAYGRCALSSAVSPVDGLLYGGYSGTCVCSTGAFGTYCDKTRVVGAVTATVVESGASLLVTFRFLDDTDIASPVVAPRVDKVVVTLEAVVASATDANGDGDYVTDSSFPLISLGTFAPYPLYDPGTGRVVFVTSLLSADRVVPIPAGRYRVRVRVPTLTASPAGLQTGFADVSPVVLIPEACAGLCGNGGACDGTSGHCVCVNGWSGTQCQVPPCETAGCNPHGSLCVMDAAARLRVSPILFQLAESSGVAVARCVCTTHPDTGAPLYTGPKCMTPVANCSLLPACANGGTHTAETKADGEIGCGACQCQGSWSGVFCGTCNHACYTAGGVANATCSGCTCIAGWTGLSCACRYATIRIDFAASHNSLVWRAAQDAAVAAAEAAGNATAVAEARARRQVAKRVWLSTVQDELDVIINGDSQATAISMVIVEQYVGTTELTATDRMILVQSSTNSSSVSTLSTVSVSFQLHNLLACAGKEVYLETFYSAIRRDVRDFLSLSGDPGAITSGNSSFLFALLPGNDDNDSIFSDSAAATAASAFAAQHHMSPRERLHRHRANRRSHALKHGADGSYKRMHDTTTLTVTHSASVPRAFAAAPLVTSSSDVSELNMDPIYAAIARLVLAFNRGAFGGSDTLSGVTPDGGLGVSDPVCDSAASADADFATTDLAAATASVTCPAGVPGAVVAFPSELPVDISESTGSGLAPATVGIIAGCCAIAALAALVAVLVWFRLLCFAKPATDDGAQEPAPVLDTLAAADEEVASGSVTEQHKAPAFGTAAFEAATAAATATMSSTDSHLNNRGKRPPAACQKTPAVEEDSQFFSLGTVTLVTTGKPRPGDDDCGTTPAAERQRARQGRAVPRHCPAPLYPPSLPRVDSTERAGLALDVGPPFLSAGDALYFPAPDSVAADAAAPNASAEPNAAASPGVTTHQTDGHGRHKRTPLAAQHPFPAAMSTNAFPRAATAAATERASFAGGRSDGAPATAAMDADADAGPEDPFNSGQLRLGSRAAAMH